MIAADTGPSRSPERDILLTFLIPATVHGIVGNVIEPRVLGGAMELHPIVVLLSLMLWGSLWGVVGND